MLPGMTPVADPWGRVTKLSLFGFATGGVSAVIPAGVRKYDILVFFQRCSNVGASPLAAVTPTGFTNIANSASTLVRGMLSYRVAAGAEGGATVVGMDGDSGDRAILAVFRPNGKASSIDVGSINSQITDEDPSPQTIAAEDADAPVLLIGCAGRGGSGDNPPAASMHPGEDGFLQASNNNQVRIYYKTFNRGDTPVDVSFDMADFGNGNVLQSCYLEVT